MLETVKDPESEVRYKRGSTVSLDPTREVVKGWLRFEQIKAVEAAKPAAAAPDKKGEVK